LTQVTCAAVRSYDTAAAEGVSGLERAAAPP
jgi:hypothetical protein